ncbi:serine/threonine-protein kinase [Streptomyces albipurpureus]|nr:serine/threonine-protein kinase [Streptomyces sp. CWNU-1]
MHSQSIGTGQVLAGRYRLAEVIGRGGMGQVWRAHDEVLHRVVAIKELTGSMFVSQADRSVLHARTQTEARAAARISHPGVVTVHDVLDHDSRPWIVMQYVDGPSLADAITEHGPEGRMPVPEVARIGLEVLRALGAAHGAGVLHRDVKPANILLGPDGRALITDFGIAAIEGDSTITRTGEIVGSIDYLAPERVRGADPGPASDLWSLGATLYSAVEGLSPFRRTSALTTMQAVIDEDPAYPRQAGPLGPVIMALLRKDPLARPSAREAEQMLQAALEGRDPAAVFAQSPTRTVTQSQQQPQLPPPAPAHPAPLYPAPTNAPSATPTPATPTPAASYPPYAPSATPTPAASYPPYAQPAPPAPQQRDGRLRTALVVAVLAAIVGTGAGVAGFAYLKGEDDRPGDHAASAGGTQVTASAAPSASGGPGASTDAAGAASPSPAASDPAPRIAVSNTPQSSEEVPAGWRRVSDPAGFSLLVPQGWQRRVKGGQIDYTPDNGRHLLRIGIDPAPDYENPHAHLVDLEKVLEKLPEYQRLRLEPNVFRDRAKAALWEFSWTERETFPGPRRAIDQMYFGDDGTEYALYMSGPAEDWSVTSGQFDIMLRSWQPPN